MPTKRATGKRREPSAALSPGETKRYECELCLTEFDITLEPKARDCRAPHMRPQFIVSCPFCCESRVVEV